jgi:hypothetical protein
MTKKHYEAIAEVLQKLHSDWSHDNTIIPTVAGHLAGYFEQDNPRFDRDRFLKACGVELQKCEDGKHHHKEDEEYQNCYLSM